MARTIGAENRIGRSRTATPPSIIPPSHHEDKSDESEYPSKGCPSKNCPLHHVLDLADEIRCFSEHGDFPFDLGVPSRECGGPGILASRSGQGSIRQRAAWGSWLLPLDHSQCAANRCERNVRPTVDRKRAAVILGRFLVLEQVCLLANRSEERRVG